MILVEKIVDDKTGISVSFYFGIDFDVVLSHPKDGSGGLMYCFISDKYSTIEEAYKREQKIDNVIDGKDITDIDKELSENNYLCIFQAGNQQQIIYEAVRDKILDFGWERERPWVPLNNVDSCAVKKERKV